MNYRGPVLALAVLALGLIALLQTAIGPQLALMRVRPDVILIIVLAWTLVYGPREGVVLGFAGGIWLDLFSGGFMGASSLALIAAAVPAGLGYTTLFRTNLLVPIAAGILGTLTYSLVYYGLIWMLGDVGAFLPTFVRLIMPAVLYNTALILLVSPLLNRIPEARGAI